MRDKRATKLSNYWWRGMSQSLRALKKANRVRSEAAALKRDVQAGRISVADAVWDKRAGMLRLRSLLLAQHYVGNRRVDRFLIRVQINGDARVRQLTKRQKRVVADES